ncbi:WD40 repeat-like protein [Rhodotorula sp. JG-1b]|nr:WD40 repeat-like protein [Rhodotorula sp. JG-1b]
MTLNSYSEQVSARHARFHPTQPALERTSAYRIDAQFSIPHHQTQIHAFAAPPCSSHLYTGGSDGYVRRYALYATLNGSGVDNPLVPNLTSKVGGHERPPGTDTRQPVLSGYWENEEPHPDWIDDLLEPPTPTPDTPTDQVQQQRRAARVRWGPKTGAWGPQSAVYSLAVQKEELWGLSGTARGSVNLWTVRHDEGQIRHVFRSAASPTADPSRGHSPKAAVSVLALDQDEKSYLSGGWDGRIFQWDLDTGVPVRPFFAHSGQISSIADVPLVASDTTSAAPELGSDVFVSTAFDGTVLLWDRRAGEGGEAKGLVRRFRPYQGKGGKSAGWCTSACWSPSGSHLYVARRSPSIEIYDLRSSSPLSTLSLPNSTGPVSAVAALPNGRHLLSASWDNVRLWDVETAMEAAAGSEAAAAAEAAGGKGMTMMDRRIPIGATVVPGHYGGTVSNLHIDPTCRWMTTTSGHRGWDGTSTENLVIHEIRTQPGALQ